MSSSVNSGAAEARRNPLSSFRHVRTRSIAVLEESVQRFYNDVRFELPKSGHPIDADASRCQLRDVALDYSHLGAAVKLQTSDLANYSLLFGQTGNAVASVGRTRVEVGGDKAFVASASQAVGLDYSPDFAHLIIDVSPHALTNKLEALLGESLGDRLVFQPHADLSNPAVDSLRRQYLFLAGELEALGRGIAPVALAEFEQTMVLSFLAAIESNYSPLLNRRPAAAAPWQVRKAEAYIEANWDQPITIEALALTIGLSARTLFHSFRRSRGYSPMEFVKRVRLQRAREMLQRADESESVTSIGLACGFGNLGHFSIYYRRMFGETPSATLRSRRHLKRSPDFARHAHR